MDDWMAGFLTCGVKFCVGLPRENSSGLETQNVPFTVAGTVAESGCYTVTAFPFNPLTGAPSTEDVTRMTAALQVSRATESTGMRRRYFRPMRRGLAANGS